MSRDFPVAPEEFETGWVEQVFDATPGSLAGLTHEPVGTGQVCDSYRFRCDWQEESHPATFVAKCPSRDATSRGAAALFHLYDMEVGWYRDVAKDSGVSCPPPYHAEIGADETQFALLLGDMAPAEQGDQLAGADAATVAAALHEAAALHAWRPKSGSFDDLAWLHHSAGNSGYMRQALPSLFKQFQPRFTGLLPEEVLDLGAELVARFDAYMDAAPQPECIAHGDMRLDNILFTAPREDDLPLAILVDWQTCSMGHGAGDVAYLIGTSFADPEDRRAQEKPLIAQYLQRREALGAPADPDAFWDAYRRSAFAGYIMAINAAIHVERTERGDAMFAAMAERPAQMALDLESLSLV
ncbi:phosphotransferase [uncultured Parasphingopyxis sp.]|uniref:phosphotransferase n=1 Tax=uncultured Parasphingopyxis sp. TaxID=1547918 RepID=UPI0026080D76|nr:phosphotransferase [uncultured Parasphingopyxis sp.]